MNCYKSYVNIVLFGMYISIIGLISFGCKNKDVNHADGPNFNEIHEDIHLHFDKINIDGDDYYILERDRNNPHEGFGFMALKGTKISSNQDSIKALLRIILDNQAQILSNQTNISIEEVETNNRALLEYYLQEETTDDQ